MSKNYAINQVLKLYFPEIQHSSSHKVCLLSNAAVGESMGERESMGKELMHEYERRCSRNKDLRNVAEKNKKKNIIKIDLEPGS